MGFSRKWKQKELRSRVHAKRFTSLRLTKSIARGKSCSSTHRTSEFENGWIGIMAVVLPKFQPQLYLTGPYSAKKTNLKQEQKTMHEHKLGKCPGSGHPDRLLQRIKRSKDQQWGYRNYGHHGRAAAMMTLFLSDDAWESMRIQTYLT
jgi:hypothetical protein